ncbi:GDSL-type esterase/lipase family protein [Kitasatospora sp. NPDC056181]|uniref:GDSL-type esterase/lipase family protein n=1 Tax=Kitasatospora sp. NPDC056181 TaxID=3345737 RepID=UPI0035DA6FD0
MIKDLRICFIGDSFTQGVGDPEFRGWVGRVLQATAAAAGPPEDLTAFNLGIRRNTSADVLRRIWPEVDARTLPGADNRLVVSVGANDTTLEDGRPRVAPDRCLENLAALLDGARERGLGVLVVGPPPVVGWGAEHLGRLLTLVERTAALCAARGVPFVDVTAAVAADPVWAAEAGGGDGAHPGAGGYRFLADLVLAGGWWEWLAGEAA